MAESLNTYYPNDESPRDESELIWGWFTEEQWERMTCAERAAVIYGETEDRETEE